MPLVAMESDDEFGDEEYFPESAFVSSAMRGPVDPWQNDPQVASVRVALEAQFQEALHSRDVSTLLDIQDQLIIHNICTQEQIQSFLKQFTDFAAAPSTYTTNNNDLDELQRLRLEEDRQIMQEQDRAYQESLRIDQERDRQKDQAARVIQNIVRAQNQQKRYKQALHSMKVENYLQEQFDFTQILDACIADLARSEDIRNNFGRISSNLGNDMRLILLFARQGRSIAGAVQAANQQSYETERDREQALCDAVAQQLQEIDDEILVQRRAVRIVENFLDHTLQAEEPVVVSTGDNEEVIPDEEETNENALPSQMPVHMPDTEWHEE